jgi:hypothetical protein
VWAAKLQLERQQLQKHLQLSTQVIQRMHVGKKGMGLHELVLSVLTCEGLVDETLDIAPQRKVLHDRVYNAVIHSIYPLYSYLISEASQCQSIVGPPPHISL